MINKGSQHFHHLLDKNKTHKNNLLKMISNNVAFTAYTAMTNDMTKWFLKIMTVKKKYIILLDFTIVKYNQGGLPNNGESIWRMKNSSVTTFVKICYHIRSTDLR